MNSFDLYKMYVNAYAGVLLLDEYDLKVYLLKELKEYIMDFVLQNDLECDFESDLDKSIKNVNNKTKFQDALYILNQLNAPVEVILIIQNRLKK